jgi:uncharacterized protein (DUF1330 family)
MLGFSSTGKPMTRISRPLPECGPSHFKLPPLQFSKKPNSTAALFLRTQIALLAQPNPSKLRITLADNHAREIMEHRGATLLTRIPPYQIYGFDDFSAVIACVEAGREMSFYPFPIEVAKELTPVKSRLVTSCETPVGVIVTGSTIPEFRKDVAAFFATVEKDWKAHPEFDPHFAEGGCDIPWVAPAVTVPDYDIFCRKMAKIIAAFSAHTNTELTYNGGQFRQIEPDGQPGPLSVAVEFHDHDHPSKSMLQERLQQWVSAATDSTAARQVWVNGDYTGRLNQEHFEPVHADMTSHEMIELGAQISSKLASS